MPVDVDALRVVDGVSTVAALRDFAAEDFEGVVFEGVIFKGVVFKGVFFKGVVFEGVVFEELSSMVGNISLDSAMIEMSLESSCAGLKKRKCYSVRISATALPEMIRYI